MWQSIRLFLLLGLINFAVAKTSFAVLYNNISVNTNAEYLSMNTSISQDQVSFSIFVDVVKPYSNFYLEFKMHTALVHKGEPKMQEIFSRSTDFCKYVKQKPMSEIMLNILYEEFVRKSNGFLAKCPVAVGQYIVAGYEMDLTQMPPYLPDALFRAQMTTFFKGHKENTIISDLQFDGVVQNKVSSVKRFKTKKN